MALSDVVNVTVTKTNPGITAPGFGIPLYPTYSASWAERTRTYKTYAAVVVDFAATTVEAQIAAAAFAQSPAPAAIMFGRCALKPTNTWTIALASVTIGAIYKIRVNVAGVDYFASYTAQGGDTNDVIIAALQTAYNLITQATAVFTSSITGGSGSHVLVLTAASPANWIGIEVYDTLVNGVGGLMTLTEGGADPGIATDLAAILNESAVWYQLNLQFKSTAQVEAAATWVEANARLMLVASADTACATHVLSGATDTCAEIQSAARARTACEFHPRNDEFLDVCIAARFLPINPGSDNWRMKTLSGPTPAALTATQVANIKAKNAGWYYAMGASGGTSVNVVGGEGTVAANEYIDAVRSIDWYTINLQVDLVNLEIQNEKIPFDNLGIAKVMGVFRTRNELGIAAGVIDPDIAPTYFFPDSTAVPTSDRQNRLLQNIGTTWNLLESINDITATVQVNF